MTHSTILGFAQKHGFKIKDSSTASRLGKRASKICQQEGCERESIPDKRWGKVWSYPDWILSEIFTQEFGSTPLSKAGVNDMTKSISTLRKRTKAFAHPSWLGAFLSGDRQCLYALYLQANCYLPKTDNSFDLVSYKVAHQNLINQASAQYRDKGYQVFTESANEYKVTTASGLTISCCPDIVAISNDQVFVIDAKTGIPKGKDYRQVQLYMMTIPIAGIHNIRSIPSGQLFYRDNVCFDIDPDELTPGWKSDLAALVKVVAEVDAPEASPSLHECKWCPAAPICSHSVQESPTGHCDWL